MTRIEELTDAIVILASTSIKLFSNHYRSDAVPSVRDILDELIAGCERELAACQSPDNAMDHATARNEP